MVLIIKQCPCGTEFEHTSRRGGNSPTYCSECRIKRKRQQTAEAKKRYLQTEKGREKQREQQRRHYYSNREEHCARQREYYEAHKEERKAKMRQRAAEQFVPICIRCKLPFERESTERICQKCLVLARQRKEKERENRARVRVEQKNTAERLLDTKKTMPTASIKPLPTEADKLAMLRAVLRRHRAAV
jgi:hypothetical protein